MKPLVKRRAHTWYALIPKQELVSMNKRSKVIYQCKVDGDLGRVGKYGAICGKSKVGGGCGAHGNAKCEHKVRKVIDKKVAV